MLQNALAQAVRLSVLAALLRLLQEGDALPGVPALLAQVTREDPELQKRALDGGCLPHLAAILELPHSGGPRQARPWALPPRGAPRLPVQCVLIF